MTEAQKDLERLKMERDRLITKSIKKGQKEMLEKGYSEFDWVHREFVRCCINAFAEPYIDNFIKQWIKQERKQERKAK